MRILSAVGLCLVLGLTGVARAADFGFESLRQLIASRRVASIEELLAVLPEDLRTHYTLVFSSRSLQEASLENPRALLFGSKAQLILTFNGNASQHGFDAVETMEFDAAANRFVFREITFTPATANAVATISDPNPARCIACHDRPARPIWDAPPLWPGVYGERYRAGLSSAELRGMRGFLSSQPTHPRYRYLLGANAMAERDTYVASSRAAYNGVSVEPPNARLSTLLATLNVRSILSRLAAQPGFAAHLDVLLAAAGSSCGPLADFYPQSIRPAIAADIKEFSDATAVADRRQTQAKTLRRAGPQNAYAGLASPAEFTELRYVAERGLNVSTQHWTLAFERGSYDLSAPAGTLTLERAFFEWLARTDTDLRTVASYRTFNADDAYCEHLRQASRASLAAWYETHANTVPAADRGPAAVPDHGLVPKPLLLQRCTECHGGDIAPSLPFSDADTLGARLRDGHYPHGRLLDEILFRLTPQAGAGRMPRGINIDSAEQRELEDYFMEVARSR
jgi:mono/diheme cytochrome c family protein